MFAEDEKNYDKKSRLYFGPYYIYVKSFITVSTEPGQEGRKVISWTQPMIVQSRSVVTDMFLVKYEAGVFALLTKLQSTNVNILPYYSNF